ncbi:MAG: phosphonate ABC transporter ATP-binding protein [Phycisphaeraceae bacterium]
MIRFESISKRWPDGTAAVDNVSLSIPRGQFCVILGPSGAGKSTLLRMVNGMITPTAGRVVFEGTTVNPKTLKQVRPRIGMVHQSFNLVGRLSVLDNVLCGTLPRLGFMRSMFRLFHTTDQRRACLLLSQVGLDQSHLYRRASQLSGGQQQRVAIARAFIAGPDVVLADEPVASLDPRTSSDILTLLKGESQRGAKESKGPVTVLCSLHQVDLARAFADRIVGMRQGRVVFDGRPDELTEEKLNHVYGGETPGSVNDSSSHHDELSGAKGDVTPALPRIEAI